MRLVASSGHTMVATTNIMIDIHVIVWFAGRFVLRRLSNTHIVRMNTTVYAPVINSGSTPAEVLIGTAHHIARFG